jgi:hypothetical protein
MYVEEKKDYDESDSIKGEINIEAPPAHI